MAIEFKDVARLLSCREFAEAEGLAMSGNRAKCPFNVTETRFNLAFLPDGKCRCWACGRVVDVVGLASAVWRLNQRDAAEELNVRFNLGMAPVTVTAAERERRDAARQRERDLRERERQADADEWSAACEAEQAAKAAIERFTEADADRPEFDQALQRLAAAQQRCDVLDAARAGRC